MNKNPLGIDTYLIFSSIIILIGMIIRKYYEYRMQNWWIDRNKAGIQDFFKTVIDNEVKQNIE